MFPVHPPKPVFLAFAGPLLACGALFLSSCAHVPPAEPPAIANVPGKAKPLFGWNAELAAKTKGEVSVKIIVDEQKAHVYKGRTEIGWTTVASGIHKYPTPVGRFKVLERVQDKHSNLYGRIYNKDGKVVVSDARMGRDEIPEGGHFEGAQMAYWMRVTDDGIGMHVGPIPHPGSRASHGCIRLPREAARLLFETVSLGTPVTIIGDYEAPPKFDKPAAKPKVEVKKVEEVKAAATPAPAPVLVAPTEKPGLPPGQ
ncbi:MAG: ErfK/YbiS/YcfS/YnhG family protein [Verrucomicrobiaceae bacterium]|nr:ErfK/YbiS/YcfS/YnhG family protein [Verrucomicrobiaceae bacterium]